ncbi:MAG: hypothetical protein QXU30_07820, partial [Sulfolobales archaeon]
MDGYVEIQKRIIKLSKKHGLESRGEGNYHTSSLYAVRQRAIRSHQLTDLIYVKLHYVPYG